MYVQKKESPNLQVVLWIGAIAAALGVFAAIRFGWPMFLEHQADKELGKMPAYQQIAKWEPEAYAQMKQQMIASMAHHESSAQAQGRVRKIVESLAKKYMKTADDQVLVDYMKVNVDEIRQVASKDMETAFDIVYSGRTDIDFTRYVDTDTQKKDMESLAEIIHSGVAKEAGFQDDQRAMRLLQDVIKGMRNDYGGDADLAFNPRGGADKRKSVNMMLEFYNRLLSLRSDQAAKVLRLLISKTA